MNERNPNPPQWGQVVTVHPGDRRSVYRRLQQLDVPCACPADGTLRVAVDRALDVLQVRSTLRQFLCSRGESLDWLERCWEAQLSCPCDR